MIILIIIHIFLLFNLQFTAWPEMLSFPYMIDKGFLIYKDFHHVYQPLLTFMLLGVYKVFGFKIVVLKIFTYILIALADLMLYLNIKKLSGKKNIAILSLGIFVLLQPIFDGNMLWYDIGVILPVLLSIYFINSNLFLSGLFVALAFLIKQQAVLIGLPIFIYLIYKKEKYRDILKFLYGFIIPVVILVILLFKSDLINDYIFWTFEFPLIYLPKIESYAIAPNLRELFILGLMLSVLVTGAVINIKKLTSRFYLLATVLLCLVLSAFPRFSLFHLQPALAIFALLIGYLFSFKNKYLVFIIIPLFFLWKNVLTTASYEDRFYGTSEKKLAEEIKKTVGKDTVYLLGPSSIGYVLSNTIPPKPWIENYVWHFEIPRLQEKVIDGWTIEPPKYIFWTKPEKGNWYDLGTYQPAKIVEYIRGNYIKADELDNTEIWKLR